MRFPEVVHMTDDAAHSPVWARTSKRRKSGGGGAFLGLIVTLLALFGALILGLSIKEGSVAGAGTMIDGWIVAGRTTILEAVGKAPATAEGTTPLTTQ